MILRSLKPKEKLGVLTAAKKALTPHVFEECGVTDPSRLLIEEVKDLPEFQKLLQCQGRFNTSKMEHQVVGLVKQIVTSNLGIRGLLIQCSDLPPYASAIQNATGLPVFDMNGLVEWVYHATVRQPYMGFV
jgi:hypothetical protein